MAPETRCFLMEFLFIPTRYYIIIKWDVICAHHQARSTPLKSYNTEPEIVNLN